MQAARDFREVRTLATSVPVTVRINDATKSTKIEALQRKQDARLFSGLTPLQIQAMEFIRDGFNYATKDLGCKIMMYEPHIANTGEASTRGEDRRYDYVQWHNSARGEFHAQPIVDICVDAFSIRRAAAKYNTSWYLTKNNLITGLKAYCKQCGWPDD